MDVVYEYVDGEMIVFAERLVLTVLIVVVIIMFGMSYGIK